MKVRNTSPNLLSSVPPVAEDTPVGAHNSCLVNVLTYWLTYLLTYLSASECNHIIRQNALFVAFITIKCYAKRRKTKTKRTIWNS